MGITRVVVAVVAGGLLLTGCSLMKNEAEDRAAIDQSITELRFDNASGAVRVSVGDTTEVVRKISYDDEQPGVTHRVDGEALVIEACPVDDCRIDYEVTVPAGTKVSGEVRSGDVEVTGMGSVNVRSHSGNLTVRDAEGEVNASAQSGDVDLSGIDGEVRADAQSGGVTVALDTVRGVLVETQSGDIQVTVPAGDYQVSATANSGDVNNELGSDPSGAKIDLSAQSGDVTVRAA
jgi:hypothetical protein